MGVSTSKKPSLSKNSLMPLIIRVFFSNLFLISGLKIRSKYLFLKRSSVSCKPCHFSGKGSKLLASILKPAVSAVFSPFFVLNKIPLISMKSPISKLFKKNSYSFSPSPSFLKKAWIFPVPSSISAKTEPPWPRSDLILPVKTTSFFERES